MRDIGIRTGLLRSIVLPIGDVFWGQQMTSRLKFLEEAQWWPVEKIQDRQREDLTRLIYTAYNEVPFYQQIMTDAGLSPSQISSIEDLERLPVVKKEMLRDGYPVQTTRQTAQQQYEVSTSGSTGKNFYVREDMYTAGWYRASFLLAMEWTGWSIGEPHLQTGMTLNRSFDRKVKDLMLNCHYFSAYRLDERSLENMLKVIDQKHLEYVWGYPGSVYYLAKYARKVGWNKPIMAVATWGDKLFPHYRTEIEEVFSTHVFDSYGCAEGIQISAQCEQGNYHLHSLDAIVEFLDDNLKPVRPNQIGKIIVTRLHPGPMPLIRYDIGDLGIPAEETTCKCGRGFPIMKTIIGRSADVIVTPSGNKLIIHFFTGILEHFHEIDEFQVVQDSEDTIHLNIVPKFQLSQNKRDEIIDALKKHGCEDLKIYIEEIEIIPINPTGKNRFIISNIVKKLE